MWGLPLVVATVVFHAFALGLINRGVSSRLIPRGTHRISDLLAMWVIGGTALCAVILHGMEATLWAIIYLGLGALPDNKTAMLYSLNAITSYGHTQATLKAHWQLMGAIESLNGWILFGLTTAFLFTVIQKAWPHRSEQTDQL
jgi:hypothetical protein